MSMSRETSAWNSNFSALLRSDLLEIDSASLQSHQSKFNKQRNTTEIKSDINAHFKKSDINAQVQKPLGHI